jgi:hypothetical protein
MVNLKEVRECNWLRANDGGTNYYTNEYNLLPVMVDEDCMYSELNRMDHIPLTDLIMEHFGLTLAVGDNEYFERNLMIWFGFKKDGNKIILTSLSKGGEPIFLKIETLDKIQNLFYFVTGYELNDIVAYNYYIKLCNNYNFLTPLNLDNFIDCSKGEDSRKTSFLSLSVGLDYNLGDLPPNFNNF